MIKGTCRQCRKACTYVESNGEFCSTLCKDKFYMTNENESPICGVCGEPLGEYAMVWHDQSVCEECENNKSEAEIEAVLIKKLIKEQEK